MFPVPTLQELSDYSGRPVTSYTGFGMNALVQATVAFTSLTELYSSQALSTDDYLLARMGICAYADYLYLRQPYQQLIASPLMNETIGSYSYGKAMQEMARNAQAMEVMSEATGVYFFDLSVRLLALRTRAGGVYHAGITLFERTTGIEGHGADQGMVAARYDGAGLFVECSDWSGSQPRFVVRGPDEFNQIDWQMFDVNAESFPADPGIG